MTLLKFSTKNLINFEANKDASSVYIKLYYSDLDKPYILRETIDTSKIFYNSFQQVGKLGWVTFYELSEVYGLSDMEKKSLFVKTKSKEERKEEHKEEPNKLSDDDHYDYDEDFNNMFKNF